MDVFVCMEGVNYEGERLVGVYSYLPLAKKHKWYSGCDWQNIEHYRVSKSGVGKFVEYHEYNRNKKLWERKKVTS